MNSLTPAIEIIGLRKEFDGVVAVDNLNLTVNEGKIFGIVGPDGAGKTTTMRIICGILLPTSGTVRVLGTDVVRDPEPVKAHIGYLSQRFSLYGDLTVWENIAFVADLFSVPRSQWEQRAEQLLQMTGMASFKRRLAEHLSGGMKQKLALICALIRRPKILLLDEPTTGVDPISRREFWTILYGLPAQGVTIVVSTPYMDEAERCMRVAFMVGGRVLACDTPGALKASLRGEMFSFTVDRPHEALDLLSQVSGVSQAVLFGNRIRILTDGGEKTYSAIRSTLNAHGIRVLHAEKVTPNLEDVFVALTGQRPPARPEEA